MKVILSLLIGWLFSATVVGQHVFKTPSGTKYHTSTCHIVKNVSEEITLSQAAQSGLQPCKICKPEVYAAAQPIVHKAQGQDKGVQCKGKTKAGNRCKHYTKIANGYCFQHQPL
jgi:hypothetical protein